MVTKVRRIEDIEIEIENETEVIETETGTTGHPAGAVRGPPRLKRAAGIGRMIGMREIAPGIVTETAETVAEIEIGNEIETATTAGTRTGPVMRETIEAKETTEEVIETIGEIEEITGEKPKTHTSEVVAETEEGERAETGTEMLGVARKKGEAIETNTVGTREIVSIRGQGQGPTTETNPSARERRASAKK